VTREWKWEYQPDEPITNATITIVRYGVAIVCRALFGTSCVRTVYWSEMDAIWMDPQPSKHDSGYEYRSVCVTWRRDERAGSADSPEMPSADALALYDAIMDAWEANALADVAGRVFGEDEEPEVLPAGDAAEADA